ncbi:MAG: hypothetical protein KDE27_31885 [Planctomycetes bacterium]|nr:hypothetical protein [Planctomycetota bacterium]
MFRRAMLAAAAMLVAAACSAGPDDAITPSPSAAEAVDAAAPATWKLTMQRLDRELLVLRRELEQPAAADLDAVEAAATAAAGLVRLGYGRFRAAEVRDFDRMALGCESWLLRIATEAGQGRGAIAGDLFRGGEERHCARCHDACGVRR